MAHNTGEPCYPEQPAYDISGWETGPEGFTLHARVRSAFFDIEVSTGNCHRSPLAAAAIQTNQARMTSDGDSDQDTPWDYLYDITSLFMPTFQSLAPRIHHKGKLTLADLRVRQYYFCRLEFYDEVPQPGPSPFPRFQFSEVEVPFEDPETVFDIVPGKVLVHGQTLFYKPSWISQEPEDVVDKYRKIDESGIPFNQMRTSRLYGVIIDGNGMLRGQLYHWIDVDRVLEWDVAEHAPRKIREKWASQIQNTVAMLHQIGVIWGDAKAENVVIDKNGDAVVIDFQGGATKGWVDIDTMGTKEGDLQGLQRLVDYIFNDNCPLRLREKMAMLDCDDPDCREEHSN